MEVAAAELGLGDAGLTTPPPPPTCPICMDPWTCSGDHRICCIPCGHVYGRSCLEQWLDRSEDNDDGAKCPQCGEQFVHELIINLFAPGNLWDGCCRLQELKARCESEIRELHEETARTRDRLDDVKAKVLETCAVVEEYEKSTTERTAQIGLVYAEMSQMKMAWSEEKATSNANMTAVKERMKEMAEEEKATAADLIEFMELSFPQLSLLSNSNPHASAPAPVDSQNNTRRRRNRRDQLPPVPAPSGPAEAVKKRRRRVT